MSDPSPAPTPGESRYAMAEVDDQAERGRLEKLEGINDAATLRRVDTIGVTAGWRCVEIGAGAGSIARGLADRAGPDGLMVAADLDPRFLGDFTGPGREVITHDITTGPVPPGDFDFAHCRAVLAHVDDLDNAVGHVMGSVRPGGWILCEEPDYGSMAVCDPDHPRAPDLATFHAIMTEGGFMDGSAGRNVFSALRRAGLVDVQTDSHGAIATGGSARAQFRSHSLENVRPMLLASKFFTDADVDRMLEMFDDPSFAYIDNTWIATWGQVPA
ncbi:MAG: methyltransferase domain-containing protein [Acidimicrobiales bacterium]